MYQQLDNFSLRHYQLAKNNDLKRAVNHQVLSGNILWDLVNDHDICYNTTQYLLKADSKKGKQIIKIIKVITKNTPIVYLSYTNISHLFQSSRMYQNLWAFENQNQANFWLTAMKDETLELPKSHLIKLNLTNVDINQNIIDDSDFIDEYYQEDIGQQNIQQYRKVKEQNPKADLVKIFDIEDIVRISSRYGVNASSIYINMMTYNQKAIAHNKKAKVSFHKTNLNRIDLLNEEARKLNTEYYSYYNYQNDDE